MSVSGLPSGGVMVTLIRRPIRCMCGITEYTVQSFSSQMLPLIGYSSTPGGMKKFSGLRIDGLMITGSIVCAIGFDAAGGVVVDLQHDVAVLRQEEADAVGHDVGLLARGPAADTAAR